MFSMTKTELKEFIQGYEDSVFDFICFYGNTAEIICKVCFRKLRVRQRQNLDAHCDSYEHNKNKKKNLIFAVDYNNYDSIKKVTCNVNAESQTDQIDNLINLEEILNIFKESIKKFFNCDPIIDIHLEYIDQSIEKIFKHNEKLKIINENNIKNIENKECQTNYDLFNFINFETIPSLDEENKNIFIKKSEENNDENDYKNTDSFQQIQNADQELKKKFEINYKCEDGTFFKKEITPNKDQAIIISDSPTLRRLRNASQKASKGTGPSSLKTKKITKKKK